MLADSLSLQKAKKLRDQILKTWSPPLKSGGESPAVIAQTSAMQTLYWCHPTIFDDVELTFEQTAAIDGGAKLMQQVLGD